MVTIGMSRTTKALPERALREIVLAYETALTQEGSDFSYGGAPMARHLSEASVLVEEVAARYRCAQDDGADTPEAVVGSRQTVVSELPDREEGDPHQSLRLALVLFPAALPVLSRELPGGDTADGQSRIAALLHQVLLEHLGQDTSRYLDHLMRRTNDQHIRERRRMGRELHDRIAHTIGVAVQSIELYEIYTPSDPVRAADKLLCARTNLNEALDGVRRMAAELRDSMSQSTLGECLALYLRATVPLTVDTRFDCTEDALVPPEVHEQMFLVVREAIYNAVQHGHPKSLTVSLSVTETLLSAVVEDDGKGFEPGVADGRGGIGLNSMQERVQLLGGTLIVKSSPGQGTTVETHVPLLRGLK